MFETTTASGMTDAGGVDPVKSFISFNLAANTGVSFVEDLPLTGTAAINGSGDVLSNTLEGPSLDFHAPHLD